MNKRFSNVICSEEQESSLTLTSQHLLELSKFASVFSHNIAFRTKEIILNDTLAWNVPYDLTLVTSGNIIFKRGAKFTSTGGSLYLKSGINDVQNSGTVIFEDAKQAQIHMSNNGKVFIYYNPGNEDHLHKYNNPQSYWQNVDPKHAVTAYMLVNDVKDLQDINLFLHGNYALSRDIDATATKDWNNKNGFIPLSIQIEDEIIPFTGNFDGNNFQISNLYVNQTTQDNVSLFGMIAGSEFGHVNIANLKLNNATVYGSHYVGSIAGEAEYVDFENVKITASNIHGKGIVGGFVGSASGVEFHAPIHSQTSDNVIIASEYSGVYFGAVRDSIIYGNKDHCDHIEASGQLHCYGI